MPGICSRFKWGLPASGSWWWRWNIDNSGKGESQNWESKSLGWAGDFLTKAVWKCLCWLHDTHLVCGMFQIFSSFPLPACPFSGTGLWWGPLIRPVPYSLVSVQFPRSSLEIISSWGHRSAPQTASESALRVPGWHCVSVSLSCLPHSVSGDRSCVVPYLCSQPGLSRAGTL